MAMEMAQHRFDFEIKFEKEGKGKQRVERVTISADTGMLAWVSLLNRFLMEANTGRIVEVKCKVTPYAGTNT